MIQLPGISQIAAFAAGEAAGSAVVSLAERMQKATEPWRYGRVTRELDEVDELKKERLAIWDGISPAVHVVAPKTFNDYVEQVLRETIEKKDKIWANATQEEKAEHISDWGCKILMSNLIMQTFYPEMDDVEEELSRPEF